MVDVQALRYMAEAQRVIEVRALELVQGYIDGAVGVQALELVQGNMAEAQHVMEVQTLASVQEDMAGAVMGWA